MKNNTPGTYLIGEIGQNHNGSVDLAKLMIEVAARPVVDVQFGVRLPGMDAIKLTKRDLKQELSASQMAQVYDSPHAFGRTYGEHREFLELSDEEHTELFRFSKSHGLDLVETICAPGALSLLKLFTPDRLKVASRDITNLPLLEAMAETRLPIILSLGMAGKKELDKALDVITRHHSDIAILHCVSEYPTQYKNVNLRAITYLLKHYGDYVIGYSDHTIGIATPVAAVAMGARIIEKHITIDRKLKGTDQEGSLAIDGIKRMVRDVRNLEASMGREDLFICDDVKIAREKLERSIATLRPLRCGHRLAKEDLHALSPGNGYRWVDMEQIIGKKLKADLPANEVIYPDHLQS